MATDGPGRGDLSDPEAFRAVQAIRDALPTRVHAELLFELVADHLGDLAFVESYDDGARRLLFRRERPSDSAFVPWPLVSLSTAGRHGAVVMLAGPEGAPAEPPPRPGRVPKLRNLGPGEVLIHDGAHSATVTYGEDGRWKELTRGGPKETLWGAIAALETRAANPIELLARYVAELDVGRHGPARVHLPVPLPGGVRGVFLCGLHALRDALFEDRLPRDARWAAADGYTGTAVASGATRDEALAAWRDEVDRVRPFSELPNPPPTAPSVETRSDPDAGTIGVSMTLRAPRSDVSRPEPGAHNTPAVVIEIAPYPGYDAPVGAWRRLLGRHGNTVHGALRHDDRGFTLLGDRLAAVIEAEDLAELDRRLAVADLDRGSRSPPVFDVPPGVPRPPRPEWVLRTYSVADEQTGAPIPVSCPSQRWCPSFRSRDLDGDRVRWNVVRLLPIAD